MKKIAVWKVYFLKNYNLGSIEDRAVLFFANERIFSPLSNFKMQKQFSEKYQVLAFIYVGLGVSGLKSYQEHSNLMSLSL